MALVLGTNCGFVTSAPTGNPFGSGNERDAFSLALKDVSPSGNYKVTEIGWWCDNETEETNFEVGIYDHNFGDDEPGSVVGTLSQTNAKGTTSGWKVVSGLDIELTSETIYWIAVQIDNTSTSTKIDIGGVAGSRRAYKASQTSLTSPWGSSNFSGDGNAYAFYAVVEEIVSPSAATGEPSIIGEAIF